MCRADIKNSVEEWVDPVNFANLNLLTFVFYVTWDRGEVFPSLQASFKKKFQIVEFADDVMIAFANWDAEFIKVGTIVGICYL